MKYNFILPAAAAIEVTDIIVAHNGDGWSPVVVRWSGGSDGQKSGDQNLVIVKNQTFKFYDKHFFYFK